jgi:polar amino acid transport system ATP-binding protein
MPSSGQNGVPAPGDGASDLILEARDVHKSFGHLHVLKGISLRVSRGEVVVILGPSGSGKSTFLRTINHLERIDGGSIRVCGRLVGYREASGRLVELPEARTARNRCEIGMVFQQFNLFAHLTALENVTVAPIKVLRVDRRTAAQEARRLLALVGLPDKEDAYPEQLSGGQQQRVAIARALAMHPKLMLFDEPTSALDPEMVKEVLDVMLALSRAGMTMIVVTHEIGFARAAAHRVVFMEDGRIVEESPPARFFSQPEHERARQFLSKVLT